MITIQRRNEPFTIYGNTYQGGDDILRRKTGTEAIYLPGYKGYSIYIDRFGQYILEWSELFPCFDFHDRMNENRYYRRLMVCQTEEQAMEKYKYCIENKISMRWVNELHKPLAPMIIADDERSEIQLMIDI